MRHVSGACVARIANVMLFILSVGSHGKSNKRSFKIAKLVHGQCKSLSFANIINTVWHH